MKTYVVEGYVVNQDIQTTKLTLHSTSEVMDVASKILRGNSGLLVACIDSGIDWGNFLIYLNHEELAFVRLLEHRGFFAKQDLQSSPPRPVQFSYGDGTSFSEPFVNTIPREQALAALDFWLPEQKQFPAVLWENE
jgi:hypothetical protein